ncbi:hypothetical protein [Paraburkholderia youngii]|uniref:hypothetical protein n=1 Tax=Paraburkholderia youngii TaxID=2782701 RepID=UPI003D208574
MLLKHGRGNVNADNLPSQGHNGLGSSVAKMGRDPTDKVAVAVVMGAAACDQHAALAAIVHAPHMNPDDHSKTVGASVIFNEVSDEGSEVASRTCHAWNELRRESEGRDKKSTIVMDAWANGPAVRLKDSAWNKAAVINEVWSLNKSDADWVKDRVEGLVPLVHPDADEHTAAHLRKRQRDPVKWEQFAEAQIISEKFAGMARKALLNLSPEKQKEVASRMIQDAYGMEPGTSEHQSAVESAIATAHRLNSLSRPPVVPPGALVQIGPANGLELSEQNEPTSRDEQAEESGEVVRRALSR